MDLRVMYTYLSTPRSSNGRNTLTAYDSPTHWIYLAADTCCFSNAARQPQCPTFENFSLRNLHHNWRQNRNGAKTSQLLPRAHNGPNVTLLAPFPCRMLFPSLVKHCFIACASAGQTIMFVMSILACHSFSTRDSRCSGRKQRV